MTGVGGMVDCIENAIKGGLSRARAQAAKSMLAERREVYAHLGRAAAEVAAAEDVWLHLRTDFQQRKRVTLRQAEVSIQIIKNITNFVDSDGSKNAALALQQLLEHHHSANFQNVDSTRNALTAQYRRAVNEFLQEHRRTITGGVRNKARLSDTVREMFGENTGDAASREMAQSLKRAFKMALKDFNAAGGNIRELVDFVMPHAWDASRMLALAKDQKTARSIWVNDISNWLDWVRITDHATGRSFSESTPAARAEFLEGIFDTIVSNGKNKLEPSGVSLGRATANSRSDARILHFKSANDWLEANAAYGRSDPYATAVTHLDSMAMDTAMMRVLGPNPRAGLELAKQTAAKLASERGWHPSRGFGGVRFSTPTEEVRARGASATRMLDDITGFLHTPEHEVMAAGFSGTRHFLVASQLGSAMISATTDVGFLALASRHVGINPAKALGRHIDALNPASGGSRALMARAGIVADSVANVGVAQARLMGDTTGPAVMERLSEFTMRASFLTFWTDMARGAFRLEFYGLLADNAGRGWDEIDKPLRELVFEMRGITRADWDDIRATTLFRDAAEPDASFLIPGDIRYRTDLSEVRARDLSLKLEAAILEQMEFAVPSGSLRGRAAIIRGAPGTFAGELTRSSVTYRSFTMSIMYNQLSRVAFRKVNGSRAANIAMLATLTAVGGAMVVQIKELLRGRDPRDMTTYEFWGAAILQGGGLGIFGDFLGATENRFGGGFGTTVAGPVAGLMGDSLKLTGSIGAALFQRDQEAFDRLGRHAIKFFDRYSGPTNIWYANLALNRMLWDNLQEFFDSDAAASMRRAEQRRAKIHGTGSFWSSGTPAPQRAPDFSNILGASRP